MSLLQYLQHPRKIAGALRYKRNQAEIARSAAQFKIENAAAESYFGKAVDSYISGGGFKYNRTFQIFKLISLYRLLLERKPRTVLELGSGSTTAALNFWLSESGGSEELLPQVTVFEESSDWLANTASVLEKIGGKHDRLTLVHNQRIQIREQAPRVFRYEQIYSQPLDFLIIDGPTMLVDGVRYEDSISSDFDEIAKHGFPETVAIDNRRSIYQHLHERYRENYQFTPSTLWKMHAERLTAESLSFYSVLRLGNR